MLEEAYNTFAETWEAELRARLPQTTWTVAQYADMVKHEHVTSVDGQLRPVGVLVTATNDRQQSISRLVPLDLLPAIPLVDLTNLIFIVGEELELQLQHDDPT